MSDRGITTAGRRAGRRRARSPHVRLLQFGALALAFIGVSVLVVTSSRAAFVAQSGNTTNQVSSAAVELLDNDSDSAMFEDVTALMPGTTEERCIDVSYDGNVDPVPVRLYAAGAPTGTLAPYLDLTVEVGTDAVPVFGDCAGFTSASTIYTGTVAGFATSHGSYLAGVTGWDPSGNSTRTFRFRLSVQDVAAAEDKTTTFGFTWETRTS